MKNPSLETASIPAQREFMDLMQHGDDFFKIELWRPAKNWYKKALDLNIESERVAQKIAECDKSLIFEVKVIRILASIAAVVVLICVAFC
jgi:hypothetical protein